MTRLSLPLHSLYQQFTDGTLRWEYSDVGEGPQQYQTLTDFCYDKFNQQIAVWDGLGQKLIFLDTQTFWFKKIDLFSPYLGVVAKDAYLFYQFTPYDPELAQKCLIVSPNNNSVDKQFIAFRKGEEFLILIRRMFPLIIIF